MTGISKTTTEEQRRKRDERIVEFLKQGVPARNISAMEGLEHNRCWKRCKELIAEHRIDYKPKVIPRVRKETPYGVTDNSRRFRVVLGGHVYDLINKKGMLPIEVAAETGLPQLAQRSAYEKTGTHDWTLSQMERLATTLGIDFQHLMLQALLTPEQYAWIASNILQNASSKPQPVTDMTPA